MCLWAMVLLAAGIPIKTLLPGIWHPWFILVLSSLHFLPYPSFVYGVFEASSICVNGLLGLTTITTNPSLCLRATMKRWHGLDRSLSSTTSKTNRGSPFAGSSSFLHLRDRFESSAHIYTFNPRSSSQTESVHDVCGAPFPLTKSLHRSIQQEFFEVRA